MANNITPKLKAFVQTDATGRVVSGTPVFRTSKPKDGNWREIPMYYRGTGSGTTTTTTTNGGSVTPTAWVGNTSYTSQGACAGGGLTYVFYTSTSTLGIGTKLWDNAALTIPFNSGGLTQPWIIVGGDQNKVFLLTSQGGNVVIGSQGNCAPTTTQPTVYDFTGGYGYGSAGEACFAGMTQTFYSTTPYASVANGSVLYTDAQLTTPVTYPYVALTGLGKVFNCMNGLLYNQANC